MKPQPIITEINSSSTLLNPVTINGDFFSSVTINKLIVRPLLQRIVFDTQEFNRVILYDGTDEFQAHSGDTTQILTTALLNKINLINKK